MFLRNHWSVLYREGEIMAIDLSNLKKDELKELFDGFNSDFLNAPLKNPTKTLKRYIPTGFRSSKVPRQLVIHMYCEAILGAEPSLSGYVISEINQVFETAGITTYFEAIDLDEPINQARALVELPAILWRNGITIPAYIVLLLHGIKCDDAQRLASQELNSAHFEAMGIAVQDGERRGRQESEAAHRSVSEAADKNSKKLQKRIGALEKQLTQHHSAYSELQAKMDTLQEELSSAQENVDRLQMLNDAARKQIVSLTNENSDKQGQLSSMGETIRSYDDKLAKMAKLETTISELRSELVLAKEREYSEAVLQRLCAEVIDELRASSPSNNEILNIAKKKFSEATSVESAWIEISNFSESHIKAIIRSIASANVNSATLDEIEEIEDGILIKFAVVKALKSLIYNELEATESQRTIADKFGQVKD